MKKTFIYSLLFATLLATGCSSDSDTPVTPAEEELTELHNHIFFDDTNLLFSPTEDDNYYYTHCPSEDLAVKQIQWYTNTTSVSKNAATYRWQGDNGYFKVTPGNDEGIYFEVYFAIKDIPPFTVAFIHPGYENSENMTISKPAGGDMIPFFVWACRQCLTSVPKGGNIGGNGDTPPTIPCRVCGASDWYRKSVTGKK